MPVIHRNLNSSLWIFNNLLEMAVYNCAVHIIFGEGHHKTLSPFTLGFTLGFLLLSVFLLNTSPAARGLDTVTREQLTYDTYWQVQSGLNYWY